jgi:hypothetical protein
VMGLGDVSVPGRTNTSSDTTGILIGLSRPRSEPASKDVPHRKHVLSMFHPLLTSNDTTQQPAHAA